MRVAHIKRDEFARPVFIISWRFPAYFVTKRGKEASMDFGEVKVQERQQNAGPCGRFTVQERSEKVTVRSGSMMAKISLCLGVLLIALVLELGGARSGRQR